MGTQVGAVTGRLLSGGVLSVCVLVASAAFAAHRASAGPRAAPTPTPGAVTTVVVTPPKLLAPFWICGPDQVRKCHPPARPTAPPARCHGRPV